MDVPVIPLPSQLPNAEVGSRSLVVVEQRKKDKPAANPTDTTQQTSQGLQEVTDDAPFIRAATKINPFGSTNNAIRFNSGRPPFNLPLVDVPPMKTYASPSYLSPEFFYEGVSIRGLQANVIEFAKVQDDSAMDCGVGLPEARLQLAPNTRYAVVYVTYLHENVEVKEPTTVAVCQVQVEKPALNVWTIVHALKKPEPLLGRFIFHDMFVRTYTGHAATAIEGQPPPGSFTISGACPPWEELLQRFRASVMGKKLSELVTSKFQEATHYFNNKEYALALSNFQFASVYGFFTHDTDGQYKLLKGLASGYERYIRNGKHEPEDLSVALEWAVAARNFKETPVVLEQIQRLRDYMRV